MKHNKNLIITQIIITLCVFALPFISLYCQENKPKRIIRRPQPYSKKQQPTKPQTSIATPQTTKVTPPVEVTQPISDNKQIQISQAPIAQPNWYATLAPFFLAALYKGSLTGIDNFVNLMVKLFIEKKQASQIISIQKQQLEEKQQTVNTMQYLLTDEGQEKLALLPASEQGQYTSLLQQMNPYDLKKQSLKISNALQKLEQSEPQISLPTIISLGMINIAIPVIGILIQSAIQMSLPLLMPRQSPVVQTN